MGHNRRNFRGQRKGFVLKIYPSGNGMEGWAQSSPSHRHLLLISPFYQQLDTHFQQEPASQLSLNCGERYKTPPPPPLKQRKLSEKIWLFTLGEHKCCDPEISPPQHHLVQSCSAKGWHPEPRCPPPALHPPNDSCLKIICCF